MTCSKVSAVIFFLLTNEIWGFVPHYSASVNRLSKSVCTMSLFERVRAAIIRQQPDGKIDRVVQCWDRFATGVGVERYLDAPTNKVLQTADCFVEGLSAMPFHNTQDFSWAMNLEKNYGEILEELTASTLRQRAAQRKSFSAESDWLPPRDTAGTAYGPEWKTLGLQDRSVWDDERVLEFPRTVELLKKFEVPSCEVFFAKQGERNHTMTQTNDLISLCRNLSRLSSSTQIPQQVT